MGVFLLEFSDAVTEEYNLKRIPTRIYIYNKKKSDALMIGVSVEGMTEIPYVKYQIRETDLRIKTMNLTTPTRLDLTEGVYVIKLVSGLHENFVGELLSEDFTENKDGTYTYQCQDMSREFQSKFDAVLPGYSIYRILQTLISNNQLKITDKVTSEVKEGWKSVFAGLRPIGYYQGSLWGNTTSLNMMEQTPKLIIRNKSFIEAIRSICFANGFVDVYFDSAGRLQIEPISLKDWQNTGLFLTSNEASKRQFKFDTTNAITGAVIQSYDKTQPGTWYTGEEVTGLNLGAFFGKLNDTSSSPVDNVIVESVKNTTSTSKTTSNTASKTSTTNNKTTNPFNNKAKKILVSADGGSSSFKNSMVKLLKKDGWTVTDLGVGPGTHSTSYNKLSKNYAVNLTIYNGCDPETIKEPVTGWLKGKHEKYGVTLVQMFDTASWTNPAGMKPYRYGNFNGYTCHKAWDDNYSGKSDAQAKINDLLKWYKKYRKQVSYCCGPTANEAYTQFKAGGYLKYKGL